VHCYAGWKGVKKGWLPAIIVGGVMALVQFGVALWEPALATFIAGIVGIVVTAFLTRFYREEDEELTAELEKENGEGAASAKKITLKKHMNFHLAFSAYYALIVIVALQEFVPGLEDLMKSVLVVKFNCPEYATAYGWLVKAGTSSKVGILGHVGALLVYAAIIGIIIYSLTGHWKGEMWGKVLKKVAKDGLGSSIATSSMVLMAFIMVESGMTFTLAKGVAEVLGVVYPIVAPLVGVLGAFMTGSNTNSNVMFGAFQAQVAKLLGVSTLIMASAQTAGGSIGSMLAPAKVIVGTSTVGLTGREGEVIGKTLKYCLILGIFLGILAWIMLYVVFRHVY
ncbi:MAG: L-lactate permease, partial [Thermacetogeniaceae bacterium]